MGIVIAAGMYILAPAGVLYMLGWGRLLTIYLMAWATAVVWLLGALVGGGLMFVFGDDQILREMVARPMFVTMLVDSPTFTLGQALLIPYVAVLDMFWFTAGMLNQKSVPYLMGQMPAFFIVIWMWTLVVNHWRAEKAEREAEASSRAGAWPHKNIY